MSAPGRSLGETCATGAWWSLLALAALVPLVATNTALAGATAASKLTLDAVSLPKLSAIALLSGVGLALHGASVALGAAQLRFDRSMALAGALFAWVVVSTATSVSPTLSAFGDWQRNEGLAAYIAYAAVFVLAVQQVTSTARLRTLASVVAVTGALQAGYGVLQYLHLDPLVWPASEFGSRVFGTFGNPDLFASYLVFPFTIALAVLLAEEDDSPRLRIAAVAFVLCAVALVLSLVRGAWLGGIAGVALIAFAAWRGRVPLARVHRWVLGAGAGAALLAAALTTLRPQQGLSVAERIGSTLTAEPGGSLAERFMTWRVALSAASGKLLTGWGPDTFGYAFRKAAGASWWQSVGHTRYANNAHDIVLQVLVTLGVAGLALYAAAVGLTLARSASSAFGAGSGRSRMLFAGMWAAAAALVVTLLSQVTTPMVVVWLWLALGVLVAARAHPVERPSAPLRAAVVCAALALAVFAGWSLSWLAADATANAADQAPTTSAALAGFAQASAVNPLPQEYRSLPAQRIDADLWSAVAGGASAAQIAQLADAEVAAFERATAHDPADPLSAIQYTHALTQRNELVPDPGVASRALASAEQVAASWPGMPDAVLELARTQMNAGKLVEAQGSATRATELDPRFGYAWLTLGQVRMARGDNTGAVLALTTAVTLDPTDAEAADALKRASAAGAGNQGSGVATDGVKP